MLPTICQVCGGRIVRSTNARMLDNPNICESCALAWAERPAKLPERAPAVRAGGLGNPLRDDRLLDVV